MDECILFKCSAVHQSQTKYIISVLSRYVHTHIQNDSHNIFRHGGQKTINGRLTLFMVVFTVRGGEGREEG